MKTLFGIKFGGLQQKIFNMMLLMIIALIAVYTIVSVYQQRRLAGIVQEASAKQQAAIETASQETMQTVLESSMSRTTALQAYIADDLFSDVRTDVSTLQAFATELFKHADNYPDHPYFEPDPALEYNQIQSKQVLSRFFEHDNHSTQILNQLRLL